MKMCGTFELTSKSTFLIVRIVRRDIFINVLTSSYILVYIRYSSHILMGLTHS